MIKRLLLFLLLTGCNALLAQAPAWQWAKDASSPGPESAWEVISDPTSSNIYAGGVFNGNLSAVYGASFTSTYGSNDGFVAKYDALGNVLWAIKIGGTNNDEVKSLAIDPATGDVYVCGNFNGTADFDPSALSFTLSSTGQADGFLAKYSSAGTFLWAVKYGGSQDEATWKMFADANGVYITGSYASPPATFYSYSSVVTKTTAVTDQQLNMFGAKYNSAGVVQWVISGGGDKDDMGFNVIADATNVYFIGRYDSDITFKNASGVSGSVLQQQNNNKPQVYILATTQAGALAWQTNITCSSGGDMVIGWGITQDASNLYVTGYTDGDINFKYPAPAFSQNQVSASDLYLAKLTKTGTFVWVAATTGNGSGDQIGRALDIDPNGNIILAGYFTTSLNYSAAGGPNHSSSGGQDIFITSYANTGAFLWSTKAGGSGAENLNGLSTDNSGGIFIAGDHGTTPSFGTFTLTSGGGTDIFVAKLGCAAVANNTIISSQTICAGNTPATFTGSLPSGGTAYAWQMSLNSSTWTAAAGTATNQNYSSPTLTTTTYFRRNVSAAGSCSVYVNNSNTITVTVNQAPSTANAGSSQTVCATTATLNATTPGVGTGSWSVVAGTGTVLATASPSSAVLGLSTGTNAFVWTVSNGVCAASTSTVNIIRNAQPASNAGSSQTVCAPSATLAATTPTVGTGAWSVIAGSGTVTSINSPSSSVTGISTGTNSFVWTVSNGVCTAATSTVTIIRNAQPNASAGSNQTVCATTTTLAATTPTAGIGAWTVIAGSGTVTAPASASSQVTSLSTGTNAFVWTVSNGICTAATSTVTIIRNAQPTANAGSNQTVCATTATLAALTPTAGTGAWSVIVGSGNVTAINNPSSQVTSLSTGTNSFVWTVSNGVCTAVTSTVLIMRDAPPTSNAGTNQTVCATTATLNAIGTGTWSVIAGSGNVTAVNNPSSQVTALSTGINSFVWTVANGVCPSATSTVSIMRDAPPTSNAGTNQTVCAITATLNAIGTGTWSVISGSGNVTSVNNPSSQVTSLSTGTNSFVWTVANGVCPSATSTVSIMRDAPPTSNAGTNQTVCATTATLNAIGTGTWSVISGSGNVIAINNPSTQVTALSTGTNSFVWTVTNGVCPSATSTVSIMRDAPPTSNAGTNQTVCATTATLNAIGTGTWSVIAGSGNVTAINNPSSQVTALSTGTNSFVWTVSNGVCASATSTVSIIRDAPPTSNAGTNQTVCATTATLNAIGTGTWSVISGSGNVTAINNPSSQVTALSTGTNSFVWTVSNGVCSSATSTVSIMRDAPPTSNAGTNQTVCATTATLNAIGTGTWSVISGSGNVIAINNPSTQVTALSTGTNSFVWTVANGVCPSATSTVSIMRDAPPTSNAGTNQTVCATTATLNAIGTGTWSVIAGSGNVTAVNNPSSQVTALSTGTNSFVWTVSNGTCPSATSTVSIMRDAPPTSNAGTNQTVCATTATLNAIGTGTWSVISGSGNVTAVNNPSSQVTALSTGTNSFVWTVSNGTCPSATSTVSIMRDAPPTSNAGTNQTVCATTATLNAIGTGTWSVISGSGSVTAISNPSSQVTSLSTGTNSFVWTVANGVCPSATSTVSIMRDAQPTSNAGTNQTVCATTATLNAIGTGTWSVIAGSGNVTSVNNPSSQVTALSTGTNSFVWTVSNGVCPSATSTVSIMRDAPPTSNAGTNQTVCATTATLNAIGTGTWSVIAGTGNVSSVNNPSSQVTALSTGTNSFVWTVSNGVCPSATSTVSIMRDAPPISNAGTNQTVCSTAATLNAIGTGTWSVIAGSGNVTSVNNPSSQVTSLSTGTNSFVWTVSNGVCPSATSTVSIIRDAPPTSNAGTNQTVCATTATLNAIGTGTWSVIAGSGNVTSVNNPSSQVTALSTGTNSFVWTVSNGVCPSATSTVSIMRDAPPISNAGTNQTVCATTATLNAIGTGTWSVIAGSGNVSSVNNPSSQVTSLSTGTNSFVWTVANGVCPSATSTVSIMRDAPPISNAGINQTVCATTATLNAIGTGTWSVISGSGNVTAINNPSSQVTALGTGTNSFVWTVANGVCASATSTVSIMRDAQPTSNAGTNQTVCATTATLNAIGTGTWSVIAGSGNVTAVNNPSSQVTALSTGTNSFVWTVANGVCPSATSTVSIIRDAPPTSNAGTNQTVCATTATLNAIGTGTWSVIAGSGNVSSVNNPSSQVTSLSTGTNSFVWTVANGVCPSATSTVSIMRDAPPISNAGINQTVCATTATLNAIGTGTWSVISGLGNVTSVNNPSSQVTALSTGTNSFVWTVSNGVCPSATSTVSIMRDAPPTSNAGTNQTVCATTATLNAIGTGTWSVIAGSGNVSSVNNPSSQVTALSTGTNSFVWTVSNGVCPSATSTVSIMRDAPPTSNAGTNQTVCATTATLNAIGTGTWSVISGSGNVTAINNPSSQVTALGTGTNSFVWTVANGVCASATSTVSIMRDAQPTSNAGTNQTVCATTATFAAANPTAGTGAWSVIAGSGNITAAGNPSSQVTSLSTGTNSFLWTVSNGICPSATSTVLIISNAPPVSNAGTNQTVCATSATLAAITPTIGTGAWSVIAGSGAVTAINNPSSQVTSLSTGTNSFVWTVSNGVCTSATSTVTILRDAQPAANAGTNQTICATTATFAAANPTTGTGAWSVIAGSGNITSVNNPSSQVTALSTGTNSFLWTVSNGVCAAATATVLIIRDIQPTANAGSNQTVCVSNTTLNAVVPSVGTGTWSVGSGPGSVTSVNSPSSPVTALGSGTNSFIWTVANGICPAASSTVLVTLGASLTAQAGSDQTVCATTATLNAIGTGTWSVIAGSGVVNSSTNPSSPVTALSTGTNSFVWTIPNSNCPTSAATVTIVREAAPVSNAGSNQTICATTTTLAAVNPTTGTGAWSVIAGSGNIVAVNNPSTAVTALSTGTNAFVWTVSNGVCTAATSTIIVMRDIQPTANAGSSQTVCAATTSLAAINPTVGTGQWSVSGGSASITAISNPSTQVTALSTGTNAFVWTVSNGVCTAATSTVLVVYNAQPTANAGTNQTICATTATFAALNPAIGTGTWSLLSGSGNISAANNPSSQVTALGSGTNSFLWTVSNGFCSATSTVLMVRDVQPLSNAGSNQTLCATSATLAATTSTPGNGAWSVIAGSGNVTSTANPSTQVTALSTGTNAFVWTVSNGVCTAATSTVIIIRDQQPVSDSGSDQTICSSSATLAALSPTIGTGLWSIVAGAGNLNSVSSASSPVTSLGTGTNSFVWTVSNGVCTPATSTVNIISSVPPIANAGNNQTICINTATLNAVGTGTWSVLAGSGNISALNNPATQVTALSTGTNAFVWTIPTGICPASSATVLVVVGSSLVAQAGSDQTICATTATLNASGTGTWSVISGSGNITALNNPFSTVTGLSAGANSFLWTIPNGNCPTSPGTVTINRDVQPTASAGSNQTICASAATLAALSPGVGTGAWSVIAGSGAVTTLTNPSSPVTALNTGTNSFLWTVSNGVCTAATATVLIIRDAQPTALAGSDQTLCAASATLNAVSPTVGSGAWTVLSGSSNITAANSFSSPVSALSTGTNSFLWTVSNGVCPAATATVLMIRDTPPTALAGSDQTVCATSATLDAANPTLGTGAWSVLSGGAAVTSVNSFSSDVTALGTGTNSFLWTVSNGVCPAATATVNIIRDASVIASAGSNQTVCASAATLNAVGNGTWSVLSGTASIISVNSASSAVSSLSSGDNVFEWTIQGGSCPTSAATVTITSNEAPTASAGSNQTICASEATLAATSPSLGTGQWSVSGGSASFSDVTDPSSTVAFLNTGITLFEWTVSNGSCPPATATMSINRNSQPLAEAGASQTICSASATLAATAPTDGTGTWTVISGPAVVTSPTDAASPVTALGTGTNTFVWIVANGICPQASDTMMIQTDAAPVIADAGTDQEICGPTLTLSANTPASGSGEWKVISGAGTFSGVNTATATVTDLTAGVNKLAWVISNGVCPASGDTVLITSDALPSAAIGGSDVVTCTNGAMLSAIAPQTGTGSWSLLTGNASVVPSGNNLTVTLSSEGDNFLKWSVTNGLCPEQSDTVIVTKTSGFGNANAGVDEVVETSAIRLNAVLPRGAIGKWTLMVGTSQIADSLDPQTQINKLSFGNNIFKWSISGGSCPESSDEVVVFVKDLMIPNAFSPNGDGINDRFVITSLDYYSQVKFSVYNRWGALMYANSDYKNEWAGTNNANEKLTDDTYYYTLQIPELKTFTGFIIVKQNK